MVEKERCLYEVLGVSLQATDDELKKAYRKQALIFHPDKNKDNDDATKNFQLVQQAYEVLSDSHERAWYDAHRDQILRGEDVHEGSSEPYATQASNINILRFFSGSAYRGYGDDDNGYYTVFSQLFNDIHDEERERVQCLSPDGDIDVAPDFGTSDSPWEEVRQFYTFWENFSSQRSFGFAEKWNLAEAPNREIRRAMERENKKERTRAKKEFNQMLRDLVAYVKKRDRRVAKRREDVERVNEEKRAANEARAAAGKREKEQRRKEWEAVKDKELEYVDELIEQMELNQPDDDASKDSNEYYCSACKKRFRSQAQWVNHEKSKKHKERVQAMQEELLANDDEFQEVHMVQESVIAGPAGQSPEEPLGRDEEQSDLEPQDEEDDDDAQERGSGEAGGKSTQDGASDPAEGSFESEEEELQYMQISRATAKKKKKKAQAKQRRMQQVDNFAVLESSSEGEQRTPRPRKQEVSFDLGDPETQPSQAAVENGEKGAESESSSKKGILQPFTCQTCARVGNAGCAED
ncbi:hypothetical protein NDN08_004172 [Rhodosorus marinus]|uniref:J domain-containing protein n=1 Tax=Rhodosorus marinus TaxID=101924 RepID=A0AAV8UHH2_9RHOD|nr:hypothetical protein NDN08_004172 [Rhodosorus marinus]